MFISLKKPASYSSLLLTLAILFNLVLLTAHPVYVAAQKTVPANGSHITMDGEFESAHLEDWQITDYYTGISAFNRQGDPDSNSISVPVTVPRSGKYHLWLLSAVKDPTNVDQKAALNVTGPNQQPHIVPLDRPERALLWQKVDQPLTFQAGEISRFTLTSDSDRGIYLDRWVLTSDASYRPKGYAHVGESTEIILPPAWAFGVLYGGYTNQSETRARITRLLDEGYPVDAYWIDSWFWDYTDKGGGPDGYVDFVSDTTAFPNPEAMWSFMASHNIKGGIWVWNTLFKRGNEAIFNQFLKSGYFGSVYMNGDGWHNDGDRSLAGDIDFDDAEAVTFWQNKLKPFFDAGLDFLKLDRSSSIPFTKAAFEATQQMGLETGGRGFVLAHVHSTYDPRFKQYPTKWSGDAKIAWRQPGYPNMYNYSMGAYEENVKMVADPRRSTYEIPFLTHDLGGYNFFGSTQQSDSLYMRWTQFSMFNPITTIFSTADNPTSNLPVNFSKRAQDNFKYYAGLKLKLFPYIYSYAHKTRLHGDKMIQGRYDWPDTQFLFGNELLVAPIIERGATSREVVLPEGNWYNFHSDELISGGKTISVRAPLDELPLFVRAGALIPMRMPAKNITSGHNDTLMVHYYPAEEASTFSLYEDDGTSEGYRRGELASTRFQAAPSQHQLQLSINAISGSYSGMKPARAIHFTVHQTQKPKRISINGGHRLKIRSGKSITVDKNSGWWYDNETRQLHLHLPEQAKSKRQVVEIVY